jgi:hypothetical protein
MHGAEGTAAADAFRGPPIPPPGRVYLDAEYLYWFTRPTKLPPLAIESSTVSPGALPSVGQEGSVVIIGDNEVDAGARSGGRVRAGFWIGQGETFGVEVSGLYLDQISSTFSTASDGSVSLGVPFRDAAILSLKNETSLLLAAPGQSAGSTVVHTATKFWGAELDGLCSVTGGPWCRADAVFGVRYLRLQEQLDQSSTTRPLPDTGFVTFLGVPLFDPADSVTITDSFRTKNEFFGGQVGGHILLQKGIWSAEFRATIAPGVTHQTVQISGATSLTTPDGRTTVPGGLFAQLTNSGNFSTTRFNLVPEAGAAVGCQITSFLRATLGYSAIYWQEGVLRPTTELDRLVSSTLIPVQNPTSTLPPPPRAPNPIPQLKSVDFWAQGVHFGLELDF